MIDSQHLNVEAVTMKPLTAEEMAEVLHARPGWAQQDGKLVREWKFAGFPEAMRFVNRVAELAEEAGHHPDIDIRYNRVRLGLVTHDAGGVTRRDASMAAMIDNRLSG